MGDAYSSDCANAFEVAARNNQLDISTKATYEAGSLDMTIPINQVIDNSCLVTVLYGQIQDISSLLLEAHRLGYTGEWLIPDNANAEIEQIIINLQKYLKDSTIYGLLRGMVE